MATDGTCRGPRERNPEAGCAGAQRSMSLRGAHRQRTGPEPPGRLVRPRPRPARTIGTADADRRADSLARPRRITSRITGRITRRGAESGSAARAGAAGRQRGEDLVGDLPAGVLEERLP